MSLTARTSLTPRQEAELADDAAPLDALLIDAALGPVRRFAPDLSTLKAAVALGRKPVTTARSMGSLAAEMGRVAIGTSTLAPSMRDRRFADEERSSWNVVRSDQSTDGPRRQGHVEA
jgi:polyhydroxyalkanoate synthase subunit PhaC